MDREKYEELCANAGTGVLDAWYLKTESIFKNRLIKSEDDFIELIAFAYSWMPTIPKWHQNLNWVACEQELDKLNNGQLGALKSLMRLVVPTVNNSIVGASKVLYFACPEHVSLIDRNVVIGWRAIFFPTGLPGNNGGNVAKLPYDFGAYGSDLEKMKKHIDLYIDYVESIAVWSNALENVSTRDIESRLYLLGKNISDDIKKAKKAGYV